MKGTFSICEISVFVAIKRNYESLVSVWNSHSMCHFESLNKEQQNDSCAISHAREFHFSFSFHPFTSVCWRCCETSEIKKSPSHSLNVLLTCSNLCQAVCFFYLNCIFLPITKWCEASFCNYLLFSIIVQSIKLPCDHPNQRLCHHLQQSDIDSVCK